MGDVHPNSLANLTAYRVGQFDPAKLHALGERRCRENAEPTSARNIARHLGVSSRAVHRWRNGHTTGVQLHIADRVTNRAGAYLEDFAR